MKTKKIDKYTKKIILLIILGIVISVFFLTYLYYFNKSILKNENIISELGGKYLFTSKLIDISNNEVGFDNNNVFHNFNLCRVPQSDKPITGHIYEVGHFIKTESAFSSCYMLIDLSDIQWTTEYKRIYKK